MKSAKRIRRFKDRQGLRMTPSSPRLGFLWQGCLDIAGHSSAAMSLSYIHLSHTHTVSLCVKHHRSCTAAILCKINSDEALPWGLVAPEASKIIPCSRQHQASAGRWQRRRRREKSYQSLEGRDETCNCSSVLAVEQLAGCVAG